jgi:hypothetical protein
VSKQSFAPDEIRKHAGKAKRVGVVSSVLYLAGSKVKGMVDIDERKN